MTVGSRVDAPPDVPGPAIGTPSLPGDTGTDRGTVAPEGAPEGDAEVAGDGRAASGPTTTPAAATDDGGRERAAELTERCGWTAVWFSVLVAGLSFWGAWAEWPGAAAWAPLLVALGLVGLVGVWVVRHPDARWVRRAGLVGGLVSVAVPQAAGIHARQYYTTDASAFNQVAADLLVHGKDPYTSSLAPAAELLKTPAQYWTYLVDGSHVTQVSYPAGSFLLQAPLVLLGFHHGVVDWVDLAAWLVTGILLYRMLPGPVRWFGVLLLVTSLYVVTFANGGTDAAFLPLLVVAVWRWDRYGTGRAAGLAGWIGPVALGLACSVKQSPWFCVPFLVVGVWLEARRRGTSPWPVAGRYLGVVAGVFFLVNLPFILWHPGAWADGVVLPLARPLVADGQGAVALALHGLTGGVLLSLLSVAGLLVLAAALVAFVAWYPRCKRVWLFVLPLVLFVPARSLSSYLVDLVPAAVVAAVTVGPAPVARAVEDGTVSSRAGVARGRRWWWAVVVGGLVAAAAGVMAVAFTAAPLALTVTGIRTADGTERMVAVTVTVHNRTDRPLTPHFMVDTGGNHPSGFWLPTGGPVVVDPGRSATVTLVPDLYTWSPGRGAYWLVEAYTSSPSALSTSSPQQWRLGSPNQ